MLLQFYFFLRHQPDFEARKHAHKKIKDLDFTSAMGKKRKVDCALADSTVLTLKNTRKCYTVSPPTYAALEKFYETLSECGSKSVILLITLPYANDFQPKTSLPNFPLP